MSYKATFRCPKCNGGGYYHPLNTEGKVKYSEIRPCDAPGCLKDSVRAYQKGEHLQNSGLVQSPIPQINGAHQTFENFNPKLPGVQEAYKYAKAIANAKPDSPWLIIYGGTGNGKSHLLNAIANAVMNRGVAVRLVLMAELLSSLRMAIETKQVDFKLKELKEIPYLLIDELGLEYGTDWEKEKIEELLSARWHYGRTTIAASNLDIEQLPDRIKSRFKDANLSRWVLNEGGDYRLTRGRA